MSEEYTKLLAIEDEKEPDQPKMPQLTCKNERSPSYDIKAIYKCINQWSHRKNNTDLLQAIYEGNENIVKKCLQQKGNPNTVCRTLNFSALQLAIIKDSESIISMLLEAGANPESVDSQGLSVLHYAAWYDKPRFLQLVLNKCSTLEFVNYASCKPAYTALNENSKDALNHECESFDIKLPSEIRANTTALHAACQNVSWGCVQLLLQHGASVDVQDEFGLCPVHVIGERTTAFNRAVRDSFENIVERLTQDVLNADMVVTHPYNSSLHVAVILRSERATYRLKKIRFNPKLINLDGETPIHLAIKNKTLDPFEVLIKDTPDISSIKNKKGFTPYQAALEEEWMPAITPLLNVNADILQIAPNGNTTLHLLARNGNVELLEYFYKNQLDKILDEKNLNDETPLICAISSRSLKCVEFLLNREADINVRMKGNLNVLHCAVKSNSSEILELLLNRVEERMINALDEENGMSALHMAAFCNKVDCVETLMEKSNLDSKTTMQSFDGGTVLHLAAWEGHTEVLTILLNYIEKTRPTSCMVNLLDNEGKTPLHCAVIQSHRECIELLLHHGADLSACYEDASALEIIMKTVPRSTDFLESIFDEYIKITNKKPVTDPACNINIDFRIFNPKNGHFNQMPVLANLFSTCNMLRHTQLLFHPLVECFLFLKWKKLRMFFGLLFLLYMVYIFILIWYILSVYYTNEERYYLMAKTNTLKYILLVSMITITVPEVVLYLDRRSSYSFTLEKILKWTSIVLVSVIIFVPGPTEPNTWKQHFATVTIMVSTLKALFLFSNLPNWGHYVQMFLKVSKNIVKVMLVFSFLIMGFTISFMIEFQNRRPFSGPFKAFVKTIAMMTSELDFSGLFWAVHEESFDTIPTMLLFLTFVVFASIAAMNLMIGLAVSDIHSLESIGRIQRHMRQIDFFLILESSTLSKILPMRLRDVLLKKKKVEMSLDVNTSQTSNARRIPQRIKDNIMDIADNNSKQQNVVTLDLIMEKIEYLTKIIQYKK